MLPGHLYLRRSITDHSASGCSPRRARPFGRAIEVFVASRDDDADYRNAAAQNASLHVVFPQRNTFTLKHPDQFAPIRNPLNLKLATCTTPAQTVLRRMTARVDGTLMGPSLHAHAHTSRSSFCMMLGCGMVSFGVCSRSCADFLLVLCQRYSKRSIACCFPRSIPHSRHVDAYDVLGFRIGASFACQIFWMNWDRNPRITPPHPAALAH